MKQIPQNIRVPYDALLVRKQIPRSSLQNYRKWLRYYLDFCDKYKFNQFEKNSATSFLKKLKEKRQSGKIWDQGLISDYRESNFIGFDMKSAWHYPLLKLLLGKQGPSAELKECQDRIPGLKPCGLDLLHRYFIFRATPQPGPLCRIRPGACRR
jgi:hypothetical protein